jgi:hypothetical protein
VLHEIIFKSFIVREDNDRLEEYVEDLSIISVINVEFGWLAQDWQFYFSVE